jgi:GNAT superfamily N-acetyltransferase
VTRPLSDGDIEPLAGKLAGLPLLQRYRRTEAALAADLRRALAAGEGLVVDDALRGLAWFLPSGTFALGGYLKLLAVAEPGRGTGAALLAAFESAVRAAGQRHAFLLVSDFNEGAQRFYAHHGYARAGSLERLVLPDVDELIFHKRLG